LSNEARGGAPGRHVENVNFIGKSIAVVSTGGPLQTIIDGNQQGTVVKFMNGEDSSTLLAGFTLTNGVALDWYGNGGGILVSPGSPTVRDCLIVHNVAVGPTGGGWGGGVHVANVPSEPQFINCTIASNLAMLEGGAIFAGYNAHPTFINTILFGNSTNPGTADIHVVTGATVAFEYCLTEQQAFNLAGAKPFSPSWLVVGVSALNAPFKGGVMVPFPYFGFQLLTDFFGAAAFGGLWPGGVPTGFVTYFQWWMLDPGGPQGFAASNALAGTAP
jgi:hypothetical protein